MSEFDASCSFNLIGCGRISGAALGPVDGNSSEIPVSEEVAVRQAFRNIFGETKGMLAVRTGSHELDGDGPSRDKPGTERKRMDHEHGNFFDAARARTA